MNKSADYTTGAVESIIKSSYKLNLEMNDFNHAVSNIMKAEIEFIHTNLVCEYMLSLGKFLDASFITKWYYNVKMRKAKLAMLQFERKLPYMMRVCENN